MSILFNLIMLNAAEFNPLQKSSKDDISEQTNPLYSQNPTTNNAANSSGNNLKQLKSDEYNDNCYAKSMQNTSEVETKELQNQEEVKIEKETAESDDYMINLFKEKIFEVEDSKIWICEEEKLRRKQSRAAIAEILRRIIEYESPFYSDKEIIENYFQGLEEIRELLNTLINEENTRKIRAKRR